MITFLTGDMFGEKFNKDYADLVCKCDILDFDDIKEDTDKIIRDFLELPNNDKQVHEIIDPFTYEMMIHQIIKEKALEECKDKTVLFWHPLKTFHPYYVRKFAKKLVELAINNNHNLIILTNDEIILNEFRIGILKSQLNYENIKIRFYWKNKFLETTYDQHGNYTVVPENFGLEEYQKQLAELLETEYGNTKQTIQ